MLCAKKIHKLKLNYISLSKPAGVDWEIMIEHVRHAQSASGSEQIENDRSIFFSRSERLYKRSLISTVRIDRGVLVTEEPAEMCFHAFLMKMR